MEAGGLGVSESLRFQRSMERNCSLGLGIFFFERQAADYVYRTPPSSVNSVISLSPFPRYPFRKIHPSIHLGKK
jgi:hypothetical protein